MQHTNFFEDVNRKSTACKAPRSRAAERTPFLMLFGEDFLSGCRKSAMSPEQVGMYIVMLILEWTDKAPLEDDVKRLAVRSGWDIRIVRRLVNELVALKKYDRDEGRLSNARMQHEIAIYVEKAKAKGARKADTSRADVAQIPENSAIAAQQQMDSYPTANEHLPEKPKENNEAPRKTTQYTRARQNQKQKPEAEEGVCVVAQLNGSAYPMIESIKAWVPLMSDETARNWLRTTILTYGEQPTRDAFQTVTTKIATGQSVAQPLQMWSKVAGTMAVKANDPPPKSKRQAVLDAQRDKIRREHGWTEEPAHG